MSILSKVNNGKRGRAQKVVIYAPEGFGKSTLASRFPHPLFLDVEDSTSQLDVSRLSRSELPDLKMFELALSEITKERPCSTLIVDTIDWLEQMTLDAIITDTNNPKISGVEDFGYGKGYTLLKERTTILLSRFDAVIAAGITVVLLAHCKVVKFEPPDGAGPYDRYELKLSKHVSPLLKEWSDMLIFGNWRTQVREKDKNEVGAQFKAVGGKDRVMHCNRTASLDAKNRHGMADVEKWDISVIEKAFIGVNAPWGEALPVAATKPAAAAPVEKLVKEKKPEPVKVTEAKLEVVAPKAVTAPVEDPDQIPGLPVVPAVEAPKVDPELIKICAPNAAAIDAWLLTNKHIKEGENWCSIDAKLADRITKNPTRFLNIVNAAFSEKEAA